MVSEIASFETACVNATPGISIGEFRAEVIAQRYLDRMREETIPGRSQSTIQDYVGWALESVGRRLFIDQELSLRAVEQDAYVIPHEGHPERAVFTGILKTRPSTDHQRLSMVVRFGLEHDIAVASKEWPRGYIASIRLDQPERFFVKKAVDDGPSVRDCLDYTVVVADMLEAYQMIARRRFEPSFNRVFTRDENFSI